MYINNANKEYGINDGRIRPGYRKVNKVCRGTRVDLLVIIHVYYVSLNDSIYCIDFGVPFGHI